jgi:Flp pilus assembly protein TadG
MTGTPLRTPRTIAAPRQIRSRRARSGLPPEDRQRGSAAVELMVVAPLLVLVLLLVVTCGRLAFARLRLDDVAHQAARAASLARDPGTATTAATATTAQALSTSGASCASHSVSVDTSGFTPGGSVTVTVSCTTHLRDVSGLHLPGALTQTVAFTSVVDSFRGTTTSTSDQP